MTSGTESTRATKASRAHEGSDLVFPYPVVDYNQLSVAACRMSVSELEHEAPPSDLSFSPQLSDVRVPHRVLRCTKKTLHIKTLWKPSSAMNLIPGESLFFLADMTLAKGGHGWKMETESEDEKNDGSLITT